MATASWRQREGVLNPVMMVSKIRDGVQAQPSFHSAWHGALQVLREVYLCLAVFVG